MYLTKKEKDKIMRLGFEPSKLNLAVERLSGLVDLRERVEHSQLSLFDVTVEVGGGTALAAVSRTRLLALLEAEEKDAAERAHRLIHGVTGD
jgi:hypothetical protein